MEPSNPFHALVKLVDAETLPNEIFRTIALSLELDNVTSNLESHVLSSDFFDSNLDIFFTQTIGISKGNLNFGDTVIIITN